MGETANDSRKLCARIDAVRSFCATQICHDALPGGGLTDRAWAAQGVLNILDGLTDDQLTYPMSETASRREMADMERVAKAIFRADDMANKSDFAWGDTTAASYRAMAVAAIEALD